MLVYGKYECFVMHMLYVCVLCASCGSSQCHSFHRSRKANNNNILLQKKVLKSVSYIIGL